MKKEINKILLNRVSVNKFRKHLASRAKGDEVHILIACLPKSGSTFLSDALVNATNFEFVQFQPIRGTNEHNIDPDIFLSSLNKNTVSQLHIKPNDSNNRFFLKYNVKVVFLIRRISDSIRSFHKHILEESDKWFMFTSVPNFKEWDIKKQYDFLIDLVVPWYINFITSWKMEIQKGDIDILEVDYDEFNADNKGTIEKILNFYRLGEFNKNISRALDTSYKKGKALRLNKKTVDVEYEFSSEQLSKISSLASYYRDFQIKI
ncbi:MAG: hypothetical protein Tsb0033_25670 [Winogradskyella sp.]